jgi:hypothetical protein
MNSRCPKPTCDKHFVKLRKGTKYCPVCGTPTVGIPLFPFYVYVNQKGLMILGGCILVAAVFTFGVVPGIRALSANTRANAAAREARLESMPEFWVSVYYAVREESSFSSRVKMLKNLVTTRKTIPPLDSDSLKLLISIFPDREQEAMEVLGKYLAD